MREVIKYGTGNNIKEISLSFIKVEVPNGFSKSIMKKIEPTVGIYLLLNCNDEIIYVGESVRLRKRLSDHLRGKGDSSKFYSEIHSILYARKDLELHERHLVESILIDKYCPKHNATDKSSRENKSKAIRNVSDEDLQHILYYGRVKNLPNKVIGEAFNVNPQRVKQYVEEYTFMEIPDNFTPKILIDSEEKKVYRNYVDIDLFNKIRFLLDTTDYSYNEIAEALSTSRHNVLNIKNLRQNTYLQWEEDYQKNKPTFNIADFKITKRTNVGVSKKVFCEIRDLIESSNKTGTEIAKLYNINTSLVSAIKHLTSEYMVELEKERTGGEIKESTPHTIDKNTFTKIRNELPVTNLNLVQLADKYGTTPPTIRNIKLLNAIKYKKWEEERLATV